MAQQDYVSKSKSKNKKQSPYKKKAEPAPVISFKTKVIALFLFIALPCFGYLLWTIKDKEPDTVAPVKAVKNVAEKTVELPKPPEEKWTYVDDLKSKEVEVGQYDVTKKGPYKMQCGSFKSRKQAEALKAKIAFSGLVAQVGKAVGTSATWYKVYLGPYSKKRGAEKDRHKLKNNSIHGCKIWNWN